MATTSLRGCSNFHLAGGIGTLKAPPLRSRISRKFISKDKGRAPFRLARPFFHSRSAFYSLGYFKYYPIRIHWGGLRLSNALSSHRLYGVRRQTFWQRPPFSALLLVQFFASVTWL